MVPFSYEGRPFVSYDDETTDTPAEEVEESDEDVDQEDGLDNDDCA